MTVAAFSINFFMLFVVIEVKERNLFVVVDSTVYCVHVVDKRTISLSSFIERNNMF